MWLSWIGFLPGLKHWFQMCTLTGFPCRNTNALIHSHMYSQSNPVSCKQESCLAELRFAEVHAFFKCSLREGPASDESLAEVYAVTSPWVVNLPSGHHSHLPLVNRIKCSAWPEEACQDIFWTCWISVWGRGSGQQTCYVNDSRVTEMCWEENSSS